jgi:uncharacterized protein (DUF2336 family)
MESPSLASLDNLTYLGLRGGVDMRPTLLRVLTDLYVQKLTHTPDEERHYTELALRLLDAVDVATRTAVAGRLARHLSPPPRVIQRLAADLPDIAAPLRSHPLLQAADNASDLAPPVRSVAEVSEPAERGDENGPVPDATDEGPVADTTNNGWLADTTSTIGFDIASELNELFFAANANERRLILLNLEVVAPSPADRIGIARDTSIGQRLETAALARNREDFAQHLAQALRIPHAQARRIAGDDLGEAIVAATKALNMRRDVVCRILLFVNTAVGHSVERVHALAALYDEMPTQAAEHMVAIWQALHKEERAAGRHRPLHWNDEARARARPATAAAQRPLTTPGLNERRDAS